MALGAVHRVGRGEGWIGEVNQSRSDLRFFRGRQRVRGRLLGEDGEIVGAGGAGLEGSIDCAGREAAEEDLFRRICGHAGNRDRRWRPLSSARQLEAEELPIEARVGSAHARDPNQVRFARVT